MPRQTLEQILRQELAKLDMSQRDMADLTGVSYSSISRFLAGNGINIKHVDPLMKLVGLRVTKRSNTDG